MSLSIGSVISSGSTFSTPSVKKTMSISLFAVWVQPFAMIRELLSARWIPVCSLSCGKLSSLSLICCLVVNSLQVASICDSVPKLAIPISVFGFVSKLDTSVRFLKKAFCCMYSLAPTLDDESSTKIQDMYLLLQACAFPITYKKRYEIARSRINRRLSWTSERCIKKTSKQTNKKEQRVFFFSIFLLWNDKLENHKNWYS